MRVCWFLTSIVFFFSSRRRHAICALVTGVQTCALPICSEGNAEYPLGQASFSRCPYDTFLFRSAAGTNVMEDLWCLTGHRQALWWKDPASNASLRSTRGKSPPTPPDSQL